MPNNLKALNKFSRSLDESILQRSTPSCHFNPLTTKEAIGVEVVDGLREGSPADFCERMLETLRSQSGVMELDRRLNLGQQNAPDDNGVLSTKFPEAAARANKEEENETKHAIPWTDVDIGSLLRLQSNVSLTKPENLGLKNRVNVQNGIFEMQNITFVSDKANLSVTEIECNGTERAWEHGVQSKTTPRKSKQPQLKLLCSSGRGGEGQDGFDTFNEPVGVTATPDGKIIVADYNNDRLQILSSEGKFMRAHDHYSRESGKKFPFMCPAGIACDASGNIAVAEKGRNRVVVLSSTCTILHAFGRHGVEQGQFRGPHGVFIDARNRIIVTDTMNCRIQVFDQEGNFLFLFGDKGPGKLNYPCYAVFHEGRFYVTDTDNDCVKVFDTRGTFLRTFADGLSAPSGITIYKSKYLLVCDYGNDCVKIFSLEGRVLGAFGSKGDGTDEFFGPEALAVTPQGKVVVSDKLNSRIQVLDLVI